MKALGASPLVLLLPLLPLLPSCVFDDPDEDVPEVEFPDFEFDPTDARLAAGTQVSVGYAAAEAFELVSSDEQVLEAQVVDGGPILLTAREPGSVSVSARSAADGRQLAVLELEVVAVDAIEFRFRTAPVAAEAIDRLAALRGSTDSVKVVYRDADGEVLGGEGDVSATGDGVEIVATGLIENRASEVFEPGMMVPLRFGSEGRGELSAGLPGGPTASLPIDLVDAPSAIHLVTMVLRDNRPVAADQVEVGEPVGVDVVGVTGDERFVAGVTASWTTSAPVDEWFGSEAGSEFVFSIESPAVLDVTGTAETADGPATATRQITAAE